MDAGAVIVLLFLATVAAIVLVERRRRWRERRLIALDRVNDWDEGPEAARLRLWGKSNVYAVRRKQVFDAAMREADRG